MKGQKILIELYQSSQKSQLPSFEAVLQRYQPCSSIFPEYLYLYPGLHYQFFSFYNYAQIFTLEFNLAECFQEYSPVQLSNFVNNHFRATFDMPKFEVAAQEFMSYCSVDSKYFSCFLLACLLQYYEYYLEFEDVFLDNCAALIKPKDDYLSAINRELSEANTALQKRLRLTEFYLNNCIEENQRLIHELHVCSCDAGTQTVETVETTDTPNESAKFTQIETNKPAAIRNLISDNQKLIGEVEAQTTIIAGLNAKIAELSQASEQALACAARNRKLELDLTELRSFSAHSIASLSEYLAAAKNTISELNAALQQVRNDETANYYMRRELAAANERIREQEQRLAAHARKHQQTSAFLADLTRRISADQQKRDSREKAYREQLYALESAQNSVKPRLQSDVAKSPIASAPGSAHYSEQKSPRQTLLGQLGEPQICVQIPQPPRPGSLGIRRFTSTSTESYQDCQQRAWDLAMSTQSLVSSSEQAEFVPENCLIKNIASLSD